MVASFIILFIVCNYLFKNFLNPNRKNKKDTPIFIELLLATKFDRIASFQYPILLPRSRRQNPNFVYQVPNGKSSFAPLYPSCR